MNNTFETIFPAFLTDCGELHTMLQSVAFALFIVGVIITVWHQASEKTVMNLLLRLLVLTSLLVYLPSWGNTLQTLLQNSIISGLGVDPAQTWQQFVQLLIIKRDPTTMSSWWTVLSRFPDVSTDLIITAFLWLIGHLASVLMFFAYIFQTVILNLGYALSPLLIGFMAIPALRQTGNRYLMNLVGVMLWPLGWAVAALVTQGMLDYLANPALDFINTGSTTPDFQKTIGTSAIGIWMIFSTFAAPIMIQKVVATGSLVTTGLFSGAASAGIQTACSTISGAVAGAPLGPVGMVAGAGAAGAMTLLSTSARVGDAGSLIPAMSRLGASKNDLSGDKAVKQLLAQLSQHLGQMPPILPHK
ncbi:MAG: hypothetical protein WBS33_00060 [Verrucomicrobiia bacterium]